VIGIPLRDVVAFLRPRGALGALEGAPVARHSDRSGWIHPVGIRAFQRGTNPDHDAALYLGDGEICPAAEGWAARVIGLANGYGIARFLSGEMAPRADTLVLCGVRGDICYRWYPQDTEPKRWRDGGDTIGVDMPGQAPAMPAERLAAVLRYELGRAP